MLICRLVVVGVAFALFVTPAGAYPCWSLCPCMGSYRPNVIIVRTIENRYPAYLRCVKRHHGYDSPKCW